MKKHTLAVSAILAALCGCSSSRHATLSSTDTAVRSASVTTTIVSPDSVTISLPSMSETVITRDSVSVLTNDYATSTVYLARDGTIVHSLDSRRRSVVVPATVSATRTDTVASVATVSTASSESPASGLMRQSWFWPVVATLLLASLSFSCIKKR